MADAASMQSRLTSERVALLAEAMGIVIDRERLAFATAALAELLALETAFDDLALAGIDPGTDDVTWSRDAS
jgi:hypothetical protein